MCSRHGSNCKSDGDELVWAQIMANEEEEEEEDTQAEAEMALVRL